MNVYVNIIRQDEHILNIIRDLVNKYIDVHTIFLLGDFNRLSFNKTIFNADLFNIVNFPTRDNAYLDHVYNNCKIPLKVSPLPALSDHLTIHVEPEEKNKYRVNKNKALHKIKVTDYEQLKYVFETTDWELLKHDCCDIDEVNSVLTSYIKFCYDLCSKIEKFSEDCNNNLNNAVTKHARRKREQALKNKNHNLYLYWNKIIQIENKRLCELKLNELRKQNSRDYWKSVKDSANFKQKKSDNIPFTPDFLNNFYSRFDRNEPIDILNIECDNDDEENFLTIDETAAFLKNNKNKTSGGIDLIPSCVLKYCCDELARPISSLFNMCIRQKNVPNAWRNIQITPVFKTV